MSFKKIFKNRKYSFITVVCLALLFLSIRQLMDSDMFGEFTKEIIKIIMFYIIIFSIGLVSIILFIKKAITITNIKSDREKLIAKICIIIIKLFMTCLLIGFFILVIIPFSNDLISFELIQLEGEVTLVTTFPPGMWFIKQKLVINGQNYNLFLMTDSIKTKSRYKIYYLPKSRDIVKIERLDRK